LAAYCRADPSGECLNNHAGFLSPPPTAVLYLPFTSFAPSTALLLLRFASVIPIILAFALIWRLVAPKREEERRWLFATALVATPIVVNIVALGQNTGWTFLAAVACTALCRGAKKSEAGVDDGSEGWSAALGVGVLVAVASLLKLFPVVLLLPLLVARRFRSVAVAAAIAGVSIAGSFLWAGESTWPAFFRQARWYNGSAPQSAFNRAPVALVDRWAGSMASHILLVIVVIAMIGTWWWTRRAAGRRSTDSGYWLLAAVAAQSFIWHHYRLLCLPVIVAFVVDERRGYVWLPASMAVAVCVQATWHPTLAGQVIGLLGVAALVLLMPIALRLVADRASERAHPVAV
jgi:hypothetical protein